MIGRLTGIVVDEDSEGNVVLDVRGVGYELGVPMGALGRARAAASESGEITLFVHTHVREDTLSLFGFASRAERAAFRLLLGIANVGPRTALGVLSALSIQDLVLAVQSGDQTALRSVPGVGKKTAERLLLELKDKVSGLGVSLGAASGGKAPRAPRGLAAVVVEALAAMGFKPSEAERAVAALAHRSELNSPEKMIREALAQLRP